MDQLSTAGQKTGQHAVCRKRGVGATRNCRVIQTRSEHINLSVPRQIRRALGPWINRLASAHGQHSILVHQTGYVGTVHEPIDEFESRLIDEGFSWDPLSLYHHTPAGTDTDGSWVYRSSRFATRQLHVILFAQTQNRVDIYAHEEFNWLRHPLKHAREVDIRRRSGAARMQNWLQSQSIEYEQKSVIARKAAHIAKRIGLLRPVPNSGDSN